jgi:digeranylgeranylglycerophospholipid reductase
VSSDCPVLDVVVVGAGPAGCECARGLADAGYQVLVAEEHAQAGDPVHCTGVISAKAFRTFDLPRSAIQSELAAGEVTSPGGVTLHVDLNGTRAYTVNRRELDGALAQRAERTGVAFSRQTRVREVVAKRDEVILTGARGGEPWRARARALVLATGAKSQLPCQVGLAAARETIYGAQAEIPLSSPPTMRVWLGQRLVPGGFGWVVPGQQGWSRVGVLTRENPRSVLRQIAQRALDGPAQRIPTQAIRIHPVPFVPRHPTCGDRVLSVGDAAGQVKMTTGGGVYYGLLAARIAARVLSECLSRGRLGAQDLARYEALWQQLLGPEQRAGRLLRRLASVMPDETIDEVFRSADALHLSRYLVDLVDFDWHARPGVGLALTSLASALGPARGLRWLKHLVA